MTTTDRRVQRTRELLQEALIALLHERGYDAITIQDITARANVGRTTFYLHYRSKDELLLHCHETVVSAFRFGPSYPRSRAALLAPDAPPGIVAAYRHLLDARAPLTRLLRSKESLRMLQRLRDWSAQDIEVSLRAAFPDVEPAIPIDVLAHYLAGAQIALLQWWLNDPGAHTPEQLALTLHRLQRVAIRDAFGFTTDA